MSRGGGKRDDGVKRRAAVRHLQIDLRRKHGSLAAQADIDLSLETVTSCSDSTRRFQSKHEFMAFPERADNIQYLLEVLRQKRQTSADLRNSISETEAELIEQENQETLEVTDVTKATKLAKSMFDLYTAEWTTLFEHVREKVPAKVLDQTILVGIRDIMELVYDTCRGLAKKQAERMLQSLNNDAQATPMTSPLQLRIKETQVKTSPFALAYIGKIIKTEITKNYVPTLKRLRLSPFKTPLLEFLERFVELCWYSQIRDPPVAMEFSLLSNISLYEAFNDRTESVDYVIWPVLFLRSNGPLLAKGVAKFQEERPISQPTSDLKK